MDMDFPIDNILTRLRKFQLLLCSEHIDQQIKLWCEDLSSPALPQASASALKSALASTSPQALAPAPQLEPEPEPEPAPAPATITPPASAPISSPPPPPPPPPQPLVEPKVEPIDSEQISSSQQPPITEPPEAAPSVELPTTLPTVIQPPPPVPATTTIGCFLSNIRHLEKYDSEATGSTSSDDSYDELEEFSHEDLPPRKKNPLQNQPIPEHDYPNLKKKAIWKWANERSRLACRWTWLQAQVADLEFRIRGQNDATMHARAYKTPALPTVLPENSCSRTVPINKDFRRRRLIKASQVLNASNKKLVKYSHVPCICGSLPQTVAPCLSCNGRYNYLRQIDEENLPITERISILDPCCHPVLSFPDDLTLGFQLNYLLKQETINRRPTKGRPGRKKGSTAANLRAQAEAAAAAANGGEPKQCNNKKGKYYGMVGRPPANQSQTMITSNKLRRKYRKHSTNTNNFNPNWNINSNNHQRSTIRRKRIRDRRASSMNESSVYSENSNHYRPNHFSNSSNSSAQNVSRRRRSEQSAYDIDNIVIPFSIAATTRVEILEYKEIVTPSWRVWENGTSQDDNAGEDVEDTSDEAYILRHSKGESEEKKRFSTKPKKNTINNSIATSAITSTSSTPATTTPASTTTTATAPPVPMDDTPIPDATANLVTNNTEKTNNVDNG